ncbi:uncharacterized protein JCM15063_000604 [Sporobolomyces koalae]|uniref:uncharacterized protein n=1 Tax=Sporobolomyces koalae TaxID=500713 RepID=UPI0031715A32
MQHCLLGELPSEVLLHLLSFLSLESLLSLSRTSRTFHSLIHSDILPRVCLKQLNYSPATLKHVHSQQGWSWSRKALWADRVRHKCAEWDFTGVSFGGWDRTMPVVRLWQLDRGVTGLLIARGPELECWIAVDSKGSMDRIPVTVKGSSPGMSGVKGQRRPTRSALDDVTALTDGGRAGQIVVARVSGLIQKLRIVDHGGRGRPIVLEEAARYATPQLDITRPGSTTVQALHSNSSVIVSASTTRLRPPDPRQIAPDENDSLARTLAKRAAPKKHHVALHSIVSPWIPPTVISLSSKPWSIQLAPSSSPSWLAIGQSGTAPLSLFQLDSTGSPVASSSTPLAHTAKPTSVYSLTTPSIDCSPFLRPDQTLVAAFFDSTTRIYDLRLPPPPSSSSSSSLVSSNWNDGSVSSASNEILRLSDPWSDDPSYSVSVGGPAGAYVAVGSARNSAVRIFDIRSPTVDVDSARRGSNGITAFGPGGDRSPVYGLAMENSRIWGVTERRGFVFNFHADVREGKGEESIAYVTHSGQGKGELRKTGFGHRSMKNRFREMS